MATVDTIRTLLAAGMRDQLAGELVAAEPRERRALCTPLTRQARAILSVQFGSTVSSWLGIIREDYPGGRAQFGGAWEGRITTGHWDAATTVLLAARAPAQAAKVWPIPMDKGFARSIYPALFGDDLSTFAEQWSVDFVTTPRHADRNRGREVMYEWVEERLLEPPRHDGAVLMLFSGWPAEPGRPLLRWLRAHPRVTSQLFTRIFTAPGVRGASLAQTDLPPHGNGAVREIVVPGLIKSGVWTRDFVVEGTESALRSTLPAYQKRWFEALARDLGR